MKYLLILLFFITQTPINIEGQATLEKINWQDGKVIDGEKYARQTNFSILEVDSVLILGNEKYKIAEIISTDSVVTYLCENRPDKEYVYNYDDALTQKNIKWRSHGLETWFVYTLIKSKNEFEF